MAGYKKIKTVFALFVALCAVSFSPGQSLAFPSDAEMANHIADLLGEKFSPESVSVTVRDSRAYAEMHGAVLSRIRIDTMRLDALITRNEAAVSDDVKSLASLIGYSKGEIVLLERDVNAYFDNNDTRGFSNLTFDFKPDGFRADGIFSAAFIFTIRIRLTATGVLALGSDGVYLDGVEIFVENMRQPEVLTKQVLSRVNPLIKWDGIPFKVVFKTVTMDGDMALMTGYPETFEGGVTATWTRDQN